MSEPGSPVVPVQKALASPQVVAPFAPRLDVNARSDAAQPDFDLTLLVAASRNLQSVTNSARSIGISPLLKVLLSQSGVVYQVEREVWPDHASHAAGNAIDVSTDDPASLIYWLALVPVLFGEVTYTDPDYANESLYIQDGQLQSSATVESASTFVHIASTAERLSSQLLLPAVRTILEQYARRLVYDVPTPANEGLTDDGRVGFW